MISSDKDLIFTFDNDKFLILNEAANKKISFRTDKKTVKNFFADHAVLSGTKTSATLYSTATTFSAENYSAMTTIDGASVSSAVNLAGNDKGNYLIAGENGSTLDGGKGRDTLKGGNGSDIFVCNKNSGNKVITDYSADDVISLVGATVDNASVKSNGDVILKVGRNKITVKGAGENDIMLSEDGTTKIFSEGIFYNEDKTAATIPAKYRSGKVNFDKTVTNIDGTAAGKKLNLTATSTEGATILGGKRKDSLTGGAGNDYIDGGKGNDILTGGEGADTFFCNNNSGNDLITDFNSEEDIIKLGGNYSVKYYVKKNDVILKTGRNKITLKGAADSEISIVGGNGNVSLLGDSFYSVPAGLSFDNVRDSVSSAVKITSDYKETQFKAANYPSVVSLDSSAKTDGMNIIGNEKDNFIVSGAGNDTLEGGKGKNIFVCGDGNDLILDYKEGQDTIKLNKGYILDISFDGDDVIFMTGGGSVTVKNGTGKTITITDAFDNTTSKIYTPEESSPDLTEDEMLENLHEVSKDLLQSFVDSFGEVDFEELLDSAKTDYEKNLLEHMQKLITLSKDLLENKISFESDKAEELENVSEPAVKELAQTNESYTKEEFIRELKEIDNFNLASENLLNDPDNLLKHLDLPPAPLKVFLRVYNLTSVCMTAYVATDGEILDDPDFRDELLSTLGDIIGDSLEDISKIDGVSDNTALGASLMIAFNNAVQDYKELEGNPTFTDNNDIFIPSERFWHAASTFAVEIFEEVPLLGPIWAFFPPDVKDASRDEIADFFISHGNVILDNDHGRNFRASRAVENIDATRRDEKNPISIICTGNNTSVVGGAGSDTIKGDCGKDIFKGNAGNDSIVGGGNNDLICGNAGNDILIGDYYGDNNPYIKNNEHSENTGLDNKTYYPETFYYGNDTLIGGAGNDDIFGGEGDDFLYGYETINSSSIDVNGISIGQDDLDTLRGGKGNDNIYCGNGQNLILYASGDGNDIVHNFSESDTFKITSGNYEVTTKAQDVIFTIGEGSVTFKNAKEKEIYFIDEEDEIHFYAPRKILHGNDKPNQLVGGYGNDIIYGHGDDDTLSGDYGDDLLIGGKGNDILNGNEGDDTLKGNEGEDYLDGGKGNNTFFGGAGKDKFLFSEEASDGKSTTNIIEDYSETDGDVITSYGFRTTDSYFSSENENDVVFEYEVSPRRSDESWTCKLIVKNARGQFVTFNNTDYNCDADILRVDDTYPFPTINGYLTVILDSKRTGIDATACTKDVYLIGNSKCNEIQGGAGNDTLDGNSYDQNYLWGGAGKDVFICEDSVSDVIWDYTEGEDIIKIGDWMWVNENYSAVEGDDVNLSFGIQGMPHCNVLIKNAVGKDIHVKENGGTFVYNFK